MGNPFQIYGPFEIEKPQRIYEKEYSDTFWERCDKKHARLSEATGLYLFSLRNRSNYTPAYVGITSEQIFGKEVFSFENKVMILGPLSTEWGVLCLHLLAKPNDAGEKFLKVSKKRCSGLKHFLYNCVAKRTQIYKIY